MNKYNIIVIGCQMNKSDAERISAYLSDLGWTATEEQNLANLVIIVTCGVRQSAEDRIYGLIPKIKSENPGAKIMITGCLSRREDVIKRLENKVDIWLNIEELPHLGEKLMEPKEKIKSYKDYLNIRPHYESDFSAFVPIGNGCNNFCAYCVVPYARGREVYRPVEEIYEEVKTLVEKGYKEIILIAQNVNSYKYPISNIQYPFNIQFQNNKEHFNFPDLLRIVNSINGDFWIRFATSHPKDMSEELIETILECEKICRHIHLPAQAGDNEVLKVMNRNYSRKHYLELIKKVRKTLNNRRRLKKKYTLEIDHKNFLKWEIPLNKQAFWRPDVSITTDIIVGFPGESRLQFENTLDMFKTVKFDMAYIAQYSPRPGTAAFKLEDDVEREEKKQREEDLMKILRKTALKNNKKYIGQTVRVLVEAVNKEGMLVGKTETGKVVKIHTTHNTQHITELIGRFVLVEIKEVEDFGLSGELKK